MAEKMIVVCNGATSANIMPTLVFATSGAALDYEVYCIFLPAGSKWLVKGELEKLGTPKGMPDPISLFNSLMEFGKKIVLCELALENQDIDPKDLRDERITIEKVPTFLLDAENAVQTYVF